jgi:hypothetical protein
VVAWTCTACGRTFARRGQGHECAPAMTLEEYFATGPARERPIFEAVLAHLQPLGPVYVEPVSVGIFLKRPGRIAQLRPATRWVDLSFSLDRKESHPRIVRKPVSYGGRWYHVARLEGPEDLDDRLRGWLTEAYLAAPE